jgi:hypothetical protein
MSNCEHAERHARHAFEDFIALKCELEEAPFDPLVVASLLHSLSHHLRHAAYRIGLEVRR